MRKRFLTACAFCACMLLFVSVKSVAQCITSFPYKEDFEISNGNWTSGGFVSDWAWGTPSKTTINNAGSGNKCWITGTLNGNFYEYGERSWLQSPCFNFSSLSQPFIQFKAFWNTETNYDGAALQYSTDNGNSWQTIGTINEANCLTQNWYNTSVRYLSDFGATDGWSGNSTEWRLATHSVSFLAHAPSVIFRFVFAAGTRNNNYNGFAFDAFEIKEGSGTADFSNTCVNSNTVQFYANTSLCNAGYEWNFNDPASGNNNSSTLPNPIHNFSAPGLYEVSLKVSDGLFTYLAKHSINIIQVTANVVNDIDCYQNNSGIASATVTGNNTIAYNFLWNTTPAQTAATAIQLSAGTYQVTVSGNNTCTATASVVLTQPPPLQYSTNLIQPSCGNNNGSIALNTSGGSPPYSFTWVPSVSTTNIADTLTAGNYKIDITDQHLCATSVNITLKEKPLQVYVGEDTSICPGDKIILRPFENYASYLWQDNSTLPTYTVTQPGTYFLKVTNGAGCTATDTIHIVWDCGDIYFPSAFTPNYDGKNDTFGPLGNLSKIKHYHLTIYNRWGEQIFQSSNPYEKWNGLWKGQIALPGTYVYVAQFIFNEMAQNKKGTLTLIP